MEKTLQNDASHLSYGETKHTLIKKNKNMKFGTLNCPESVKFHRTEVLGVPSDAEFRDLSFEKGPRASGSHPGGKQLKKYEICKFGFKTK